MRKTILVLWILYSVLVTPLFANAAAPIWDGESGVMLFDEKSGIALNLAHIRYTIQEERADLASVQVTYELENLEDADRSLILYFMHSGTPEEFTATLDGQLIPTGEPFTGGEPIANWKHDEDIFFKDPIDGRVFNDLVEVTQDNPTTLPFRVAMDARGRHTLEIQFATRAAYFNREVVINKFHTQVYFLSPAFFFEGDTETILEVEVPSGFAFESSIPLERKSASRYQETFDTLPADTWVLTYAKKNGLPFGTNRRSRSNLITGILFLSFSVALLILKKRSRYAWLLLLPMALTVWLFRPGYGTMFMIVIFGPMILTAVVFLLLIRWMIVKNHKKRESR